MMRTILLAGAALLMAAPAFAGDMASDAQIKAAISGNTIQGDMSNGTKYTEFYAVDGTIKGKDYKGKWRANGGKMCFTYDGTPEDCWGVEIKGESIVWYKDGKKDGTGTLVMGNPNNF